MKTFFKYLLASLVGVLCTVIITILFALLLGFGHESNHDRIQRERWEQSPYGG